jgi:WD40 repeat protein
VWDRRKLPAQQHSGSAAAASSQAGQAPGALASFSYHREAVLRVEWSPHSPGVMASGGEDHLVVVWSLERGGRGAPPAAPAAPPAGGGGGGGGRGRGGGARGGGSGGGGAAADAPPPEVVFKHVGHRGGVSVLL